MKKKFIFIFAVILIILAGATGYFIAKKQAPSPNQEQVSLREGQRDGSLLVEKIYPDRVTGLNFVEYPVATNKGLLVTLRVGETVSNGCTVTLTLIRIESDVAVFIKKTDFSRPCPICLAGNTLINTPSGKVQVKDLRVGMLIWTADNSGNRAAGVVEKTSKAAAPPGHQMVHLVLDDGREIFVSPGHPTIKGAAVGELKPGQPYDGAFVASAERVQYNQDSTYDALPSGKTGFYWANGILLGSTLKQ